MRNRLIVAFVTVCSVLSAGPAFASYVVDSPGTGIERLQFPGPPIPTPVHIPTVVTKPKPVVTSVPRLVYSAPLVSHGSYGSPQAIAAQIVSAGQLGCFDSIIARESGWNVHAVNPSSGAYGLPQALPGDKMASAGPDWQNNPTTQIRWALGYMNGRYGSPCGAWGFWQAHGWY